MLLGKERNKKVKMVDIVSVIRCKDCSHFTNNIKNPNLRDGFCNRIEVGWHCKVRENGMDYCSYAERMER